MIRLRYSLFYFPAILLAFGYVAHVVSDDDIGSDGARFWPSEVKAADRLLEDHPGDAAATRRKVRALRMLGAFDEALAASKAAVAGHLDSGLHAECAWVHIQQGAWESALSEAGKALVLKPESVEARLLQGIAWRELGNTRNARIAFQGVCELVPDHTVGLFNLGRLALDKKDWHAAIQYFDRVLALDPTIADAFFQRARAHLEMGAMARARQDINRALAKMPLAAELYLLRAEINEREARSQAAADDSYMAIQLGTEKLEAYLILARCANVMGDWTALKIAASTAVTMDKNSSRAWHLLGRAQRELGDEKAALTSFNRAIACDPQAWNSLLERAAMYITMEKFEEAVADCTVVIKSRPSAFVYALRGYALLKANKLEKAFGDANNAVTLDGREAKGLLVRANINLCWKNLEAARRDALRAEAVAPALVWAPMTLAEIELLAENGAKAVAAASRAISLSPDQAAGYWLRGRCRKLAGDHAAAANDFRKAMVLDPSLVEPIATEMDALDMPGEK